MTSTPAPRSPGAVVDGLCAAVNAHDLDAIVGCFATDYRNETPVHPARGFQGSAQVRRNWDQILGGVPDIEASVSWIEDATTAWTEWEMRGTRRDGAAHLIRGVVIFGVEDGLVTWAHFYLEPVDAGTADVNDAVHRSLTSGAHT